MKKVYEYNDLENCILSCLLQKHELMQKLILEDKHFIKNQRTWKFMKAFYKMYHNFDLTLMCSVATNKWKLMQYIIDIEEYCPTPSLFNEYQKQMIKLYEEGEKEKWIINKVYDATMDLWVRKTTSKEFKNRIEEIYENVEKLYKEV